MSSAPRAAELPRARGGAACRAQARPVRVGPRSELLALALLALLGLARVAPAQDPRAAGASAWPELAPDATLEELRRLLDDGRAEAANELASRELAHERDPLRAARLDVARVEALRLGNEAFEPATLALAGSAAGDLCTALGESSPAAIEARFQLALVLGMQRRRAEERALLEELLTLELADGGLWQRRVARTCIALAETCDVNKPSELALAARSLQLAETIQERIGKGVDVAWRLSREGTTWHGVDSVRARAAYERALAIESAVLRPNHPMMGTDLHNLGLLLENTGDLGAAKDVLEEALVTRLAAFGPRHRHVGYTLQALAHLELALLSPARARDYAERALAVLEGCFEPGDPRLATPLDLVAQACEKLHDDVAAARACERAFALLDRARSEARDDPAMRARIHRVRAQLSERSGDWQAARKDLAAALTLLEDERTGGADHAVVLVDLGGLESEHAQAVGLEHLRAGVAGLEASVGGDAPLVAYALSGLAGALKRDGTRASLEEALEVSLRSEEILMRSQRRTAAGLEQRASALYVEQRSHGLATAIDLCVEHPELDGAARVWRSVIGARALVFDELAQRFRRLRTSEAPAVRAVSARLAEVREELSRVASSAGPVEDSREPRAEPARDAHARSADAPRAATSARAEDGQRTRAETLAALAAQRDGLERELLARAPPAEAVDPGRAGAPDSASLSHALGARALVAYVRYERSQDEHAYAAFVLRPHETRPALIALGDAGRIEAQVTRALASARARGTERDWRASALGLRQSIWDPVAAFLGAVDEVVLVPDGALCVVPFAALPTVPGRYLVDDGPLFSWIGAERDLLEPPSDSTRSTRANAGLLALGGADFGLVSAPEVARFTPLESSRAEAQAIADAWRERHADEPVELLTGAEATQSSLARAAIGKRVIHLATHGFAAGAPAAPGRARSDASASHRERTRGGSLVGQSAPAPTGLLRSLSGDPLLSAGLVFAGANLHVDRSGGDGILTAEEALDLDLGGVELVVLSACESGLGELLPLEGLFGMPRALRLAGARTVVQSLWPVVDQTTLEWMKAFYAAQPERPEHTAFAVRAAMRARLAVLRASGTDTHPFEWGAFVAIGTGAARAAEAGR